VQRYNGKRNEGARAGGGEGVRRTVTEESQRTTELHRENLCGTL